MPAQRGFDKVSDIESKTLARFLRDNVSQDVDVIVTDDFRTYPKAISLGNVVKRSPRESTNSFDLTKLHCAATSSDHETSIG